LGRIYGAQWRGFSEVDQIRQAESALKADPFSSRLFVSAWNPAEIAGMALPPCHVSFQLYAADGRVSCHVYQRSADLFLGVPFNIASYALLTHMFAASCGKPAGDLILSFGDAHIYRSHFPQTEIMLSRSPNPLPTLSLPKKDSVLDYAFEDFELRNYAHRGALGAPVPV
jgi:thymidylate synthase